MEPPERLCATVRGLVAVLASTAALMVPTASMAASTGSATAGDPVYPMLGNGGYDARHYALDVSYEPSTKAMSGTITMTASATQDLSRFSFDLSAPGVTVDGVSVDGTGAVIERTSNKLVVSPPQAIASGRSFAASVRFHGQPTTAPRAGNTQTPTGWMPTPDGGLAFDEPDGTSHWLPVNDTVLDKATWTTTVSVPQGVTAIGPGRLTSHVDRDGRSTWTWNAREPMVPYALGLVIGDYDLTTRKIRPGLVSYTAVNRRLPSATQASARAEFARLPSILRRLESWYGPYPFDTVGGIAANGGIGEPLEMQTKPLYDARLGQDPNDRSQAHELGHQWFGDSVSLARWQDIWLNEGFGTFSREIIDAGRIRPAYAAATALHLEYRALGGPIAAPPPGNLFSAMTYDVAAAGIQALVLLVGDKPVRALLHDWTRIHRNGNATTADFLSLTRRDLGRASASFLKSWLYARTRPKLPRKMAARMTAELARPPKS